MRKVEAAISIQSTAGHVKPGGNVGGRIQSTAGHVKPGGNTGGPSSKPKYYSVTDREQYREGKVKRTPGGE